MNKKEERVVKKAIAMFAAFVTKANVVSVPAPDPVPLLRTLLGCTEPNPRTRALCNMSRDDIVREWDILFAYIHANFPRPPSFDFRASLEKQQQDSETTKQALSEVKRILQWMEEDSTLFGFYDLCCKWPPEIMYIVLPVAFARCLLRNMNMPFEHRRSTTFKEFHTIYGDYILHN